MSRQARILWDRETSANEKQAIKEAEALMSHKPKEIVVGADGASVCLLSSSSSSSSSFSSVFSFLFVLFVFSVSFYFFALFPFLRAFFCLLCSRSSLFFFQSQFERVWGLTTTT